MNEFEEIIASTDALIAQTATFIRGSRERLAQDAQWLRFKGIDLEALKAQADALLVNAQSVESLVGADADPVLQAQSNRKISAHRKMQRRLV